MDFGESEPETSSAPALMDLDQIKAPLEELYRDFDRWIAVEGPVCELSGRCCRFLEYDHTLFLTVLESAYLIANAPNPVRPLDDGATCPWQDHQGRCTARDARPLGCRAYFCDPRYEGKAGPLTERGLARLRTIVETLGTSWSYAPLHHHLHAAQQSGLIQFPTDGPEDDPKMQKPGVNRQAGSRSA